MTHQPQSIDEILTRGVDGVVVLDDLKKKLASGKPLRVKHGIDPTTAALHIGYGVVYWKLRALQELGHTIVFLIGDFTGRFGDPDTNKQRPLRTKEEVATAAETYLEQVGKILDLSKTEIRHNSEWYDKMSAEDLIRLCSQFSVAQLLERDKFVERMASGTLGYHEPIYPILQGHDSVELRSDLTVIGSDQLFNELMARPLQERAGQVPQDILTMKLLIGTDGARKMSQSLGNTIGITEPAHEQFGKIMRIPDELIGHYFELATMVPMGEVDEVNRKLAKGTLSARDAKLRLAREVVGLYYGVEEGKKQEEEFVRVFSQKETPIEIDSVEVKLVDENGNRNHRVDHLIFAMGFTMSKSEAQRLVESGAVSIDGEVHKDWQETIELRDGQIVRVGRKYKKIALV